MATVILSSGQTFTVPAGVSSVSITMYGQRGGAASTSGGLAARVVGTLSVTAGQVLRCDTYSPGNAGGGGRPGGVGGSAAVLRDVTNSYNIAVAGGGGGSGAGGAVYNGGGGGNAGGFSANASEGQRGSNTTVGGFGGQQGFAGANGVGGTGAGGNAGGAGGANGPGQGGSGGTAGNASAGSGGGGGSGNTAGGGGESGRNDNSGAGGGGGGGGTSYHSGALGSVGIAIDSSETYSHVDISYNRPPNTPSISSPGNGAATSSTGSLAVAATVSDPDGDNVTALFRWANNSGFTSSTDVWGTTVGNGGSSTATLSGLPLNSTIWLRAFTHDGAVFSAPHEITFFTIRNPDTPTSLGPTGARGVDTVTLTAVVSSPDGRNVYAAFETSTDNASWTQRNGSTVASGGTSTLSFAGASNTTYYLRARTIDSSGYASGYTGTVTYITNRPPGTPGAFTAPSAGQVVSGSATINWGDASEPDSQALTYSVDLSTNGGSSWTNIKSGLTTSTTSYDFSAAAAGTNTKLRTRASDPAGLVSAYRESAVFTVDRLPNAPTNVVPADEAITTSQGTVAASATVSDPDGGTLNALFRWSTSSAFTSSTDVTGSSVASGGTSSASLTGLPRNSRIYLRVFTMAGATSSTATQVEFFTDRDPTAPTITSAANRVLHPNQVDFFFTAADADGTAVEQVRLRRKNIAGVSEWWTGSAWTTTADTAVGGAPALNYSWAGFSTALWLPGPWSVAVATRHSNIWSPYSAENSIIVVPYTLQMVT